MLQTGKKIALLRKMAGLSQEELAEILFVSRELVSKWETNRRNPDYKMIVKISNVFNVSADEFFLDKESVFNEIMECFPKNQNYSQEQMTEIFNSFLDELSKTEKIIFLARYYYCQSSDETASALGLRSGYVRKKLTMIRKKLSIYVKEEY